MKNILKTVFLISCAILLINNYSFSQDELAAKEEQVSLYVGEAKAIPVNNPTRVIINNPAVADVTSVNKEEIFVAGKAIGATNLVWRDNSGEHIAKVLVLAEDTSTLKMRIDNILKALDYPNVYTRGIDSEGKVLLLGNVKIPQDIERITSALGVFKDKITDLIQVKEEESVVEIDVQVLELSQDGTKELGIQWPSSVAVATDAKADGNTWVLDPEAAGSRAKFQNFFKILQWSRTNFYWKVNLLVQEGKARILSQPKLACQSGKEADLLVGGEKPIMTTSVAATTGATGTEVEYKEYGIKLKIKPTVTPEKKIKLALKVEVSDVGTAEILGNTTSPSARAYPLTKRSASTELFLNDDQTMVIGGLIKQKTTEDLRKFPFLGDVPFLGLLFRTKSTKSGGGAGERGDTELFITLTPKIIKEGIIKTEAKVEIPPPPQSTPPVPVPEEAEAQPSLAQTTISSMPGYIRAVSKRIRDNLDYPWAAKQADLQGALRLGIRLDYTGKLLDVKVIQSSGYSVLDENAISVVKKAAPYSPFPSEIEQNELWLDIPIVYNVK